MKILSSDLRKHYRRSNFCLFNRHAKWPGRKLNAIASHSGYGQRNRGALSRHINGEAYYESYRTKVIQIIVLIYTCRVLGRIKESLGRF